MEGVNQNSAIIFNKPNALMAKHVKAHFNGVPVSKVLIDNGASVSILPFRMMKHLQKIRKGFG